MRNRLFAMSLTLALSSCLSPSSIQCPNGVVCPVGMKCAAKEQICINNACGNGIVDPGEVCDDGNNQ